MLCAELVFAVHNFWFSCVRWFDLSHRVHKLPAYLTLSSPFMVSLRILWYEDVLPHSYSDPARVQNCV